jgi:hypothetical protein
MNFTAKINVIAEIELSLKVKILKTNWPKRADEIVTTATIHQRESIEICRLFLKPITMS